MLRLLSIYSLLLILSSVQVSIRDEQGNPIPNIRVQLELYRYETHAGQTAARVTFSGRCKTDQNGECTIVIGGTDGVLRGWLDLGEYGGRDVIWTGGPLVAPILIDLETKRVKGLEAGAFDFQEQDGGVRVQGEVPWLVILAAALMTGGIVCWAYLRSRSEHA